MKNKENIGNNGVYFKFNPQNSVNNSRIKLPFAGEIGRAALSIIAALGALFTIITMFSLKVETFVPIVAVAVSSLAFNFACLKLKRPSLMLLLGFIIALAAVLFAFPSIERGGTILYEQSYKAISASMYWDTPEFTYKWSSEYYADTNLVIGLLSVLLTLAISYFITIRTSFIAIFLLTFPFFEVGAAFGCVPNHFAFATMLASWAAMIAFYQANHVKKDTKKRKTLFIGKKGEFAGSAIVIAAIVLSLFFAGKEFLGVIGMARSENIDILRKDVKTTAEEVIDYILGKDNDGSLKEGKLLELDDHKVKDRHYITMETSLPSINNNLYLTGYSATKYKGTEWGQTENYAKYSELFAKLEASSYKIPAINGALLRNHDNYGKFEQAHITLSDFRRVKNYAYLAGIPDTDETFSTIHDYSLAPKDSEKYEYDIFSNPIDRFEIKNSGLYKYNIFKNQMKAYGAFAKEEYTVSSSTENVRALAQSLQDKDVYKTIDNVRYYLNDNIEYTFIVNKSPANVDFVDNFLFTEKKGYSAHYATAAAVLMQNCGIPTRYVEGYCILKEDFNASKDKNKYGWITFDVTDKYAHAWIEYYDDTYGWVPVDMTPGFWEGSFYDFMQQFITEPEEEEPIEEIIEEEEVVDEETVIEIPEEVEEDSLAEILEKEKQLENERLEKLRKQRLKLIMTIAVSVGAAILVIALIIIARVIFLKRRKKRLGPDNPHRSVYENFKYLRKLAKFEKIDPVFHSSEEYVESFKARSEFIDEKELEKVFAIILKNAYSKDGANREDAELVYSFVDAYAKRIRKAKRLPQRIKRRRLKNKQKRLEEKANKA